MSEKRYYWLKLPRDFFKRHDIKFIKTLPNGREIAFFYTELMAESVDHDGELRFSPEIPYSEGMLAALMDTPIEIVTEAMKVLKEFGLVKVSEDGTIILPKVIKMIDSASDTDGARRVRRFRERQQEKLQNVTPALQNVTATVTNDNESKSKSKSKSKMSESESYVRVSKCRNKQNDSGSPDQDPDDRPTDHRLTDYKKVFDLFKRECPSLNTVVRISDKRKGILNEFAKAFTAEEITLGFRKAEKSKFLRGEVSDNGKPFRFVFEWFFKPENFNKVCEGRYDNRPGKIQIEESETDYAALEEELLAN